MCKWLTDDFAKIASGVTGMLKDQEAETPLNSLGVEYQGLAVGAFHVGFFFVHLDNLAVPWIFATAAGNPPAIRLSG